MTALPLGLTTLAADLSQRIHSRSTRAGSPFVMNVKGDSYTYIQRQVGGTRRAVYVGPKDAPETSVALENNRVAREQERADRNTVRLLVRAGLPAPSRPLGRVLDALADAGIFADATLVGTAAYQCYPPITGYALPHGALVTGDVDIASATLAMPTLAEGETFLDVLKRADPSFAPIPGLQRNAMPSGFRAADGFIVDLVSQQRTRADPDPLPIAGAEAGAVPLQYIRWLTTDPVRAVALHGIGIAVRVPQPARYAIHKLILAQIRRDAERAKRAKDMAQARALIAALSEGDPYALSDAYDDARQRGQKGWAQPIARSLKELDLTIG